jgi:poly(A) polymerase
MPTSDFEQSDTLPEHKEEDEPMPHALHQTHTSQLPQYPHKSPPVLSHLPIYRYENLSNTWDIYSGDETIADGLVRAEQIQFATYNVLFDLYHKDLVQTDKRLPHISALLERCQADIIGLQEVTPQSLEYILRQPWITEQYFISAGPDSDLVKPYGQVLLSRFPIRKLYQLRYTKHKHAIIAEIDLADQVLIVMLVHLSSNRRHNAEQNRIAELNALMSYLKPDRPEGWHNKNIALMGDFNTSGHELDPILQQHGFSDIWPVLHPTDAGYTYDPQTNRLAEYLSLSKTSMRLDRIYTRSPEHAAFRPITAQIFGREPLAETAGEVDLYASDHFGLLCVLNLPISEPSHNLNTKTQFSTDPNSLLGADSTAIMSTAVVPALQLESHPDVSSELFWAEVGPIYRSAIVVMPPRELWPPIQSLREQYDRSFMRWMPHINLIYGFVPEDYFAQAAALIQNALASFEPFEIHLREFSSFAQKRHSSLWLKPDSSPPNALCQLQATLQALFPLCDEQIRKSERGFTPHLTVGQCSQAHSQNLLAQWQKTWKPQSFRVSEVHLISRRNDEPFAIRHSIILGQAHDPTKFAHIAGASNTGDNTSPQTGADHDNTKHKCSSDTSTALLGDYLAKCGIGQRHKLRHLAFELIAQAQIACFRQRGIALSDPTMYLLGSSHLQAEGPNSDLDLLCVGPSSLARRDLFADIKQHLSTKGYACYSRIIEDARTPLLEILWQAPPTHSEQDSTANVETLIHSTLEIDLLYAEFPEDLWRTPPQDWSAALLSKLDETSQRSAIGYLEAEAILHTVRTEDLEAFRMALRAIKTWAYKRQIDAHALGFLGGLSWAILLAWVYKRHFAMGVSNAQTTMASDPSKLLSAFFQSMIDWDWSRPISLCPTAHNYKARSKRDRMMILTSIEPIANTVRNIIPSTQAILGREWRRAYNLILQIHRREATWDDLFDNADVMTTPDYLISLDLQAQTLHDFRSAHGWLEANIIRLLLALETIPDIHIRPLTKHTAPKLHRSQHGPQRTAIQDNSLDNQDIVLCQTDDLRLTASIRTMAQATTSQTNITSGSPDILLPQSFIYRHWLGIGVHLQGAKSQVQTSLYRIINIFKSFAIL